MWRDLTVPDAEAVGEFYREVAGWELRPVEMGGYSDYAAAVPGSEDEVVAGICHARGENAKLPPQWLIYITVADADEGARKCVAAGGEIIDGPRDMGGGRVCVFRDPAGAVAALYAP